MTYFCINAYIYIHKHTHTHTLKKKILTQVLFSANLIIAEVI